MKNLHQYMLILVAGVLGACGSMSVNEPYAEALPADFNPQEYLTLHPELHIAEIKDYVYSEFSVSILTDALSV